MTGARAGTPDSQGPSGSRAGTPDSLSGSPAGTTPSGGRAATPSSRMPWRPKVMHIDTQGSAFSGASRGPASAQRTLSARRGKRGPWPQGGPSAEGVPSLIGNLEQAICARLDRIESSLQRLHLPPEAAEREDKVVAGVAVPPSPTSLIGGRTVKAIPETERFEYDDLGDEHPGNLPPAMNSELVVPPRTEISLRPEWKPGRQQTEAVAALSNERRRHLDASSNIPDSLLVQSQGEERAKAWWIIPPSSRFRLCWDLAMMFIIAHDMAVVPVTLAFDTGDNAVTRALFWPFIFYWSLDIPLSFLTGFYQHGRTEMRPPKVAWNYIFTWFFLDVFMVGTSWFEVGSQGYILGRAGKSLRVLRMMRCLQILRIAKLRQRFEEFHERITSDYHHILISICKLILTIVWLNHFIACCWWALGVSSADGGRYDSWTSHGKFEETSLGFQYFSSLHWSLTQFTPAAMEVSARNLPERVFSVFILLFAMVSFSSFVSSITAAMTQLRQLNSHRETNISLLRRYLRFHDIPMDLTVRVMQFVDYRISKQKSEIQEEQVEFLQCLSKPLQMELSEHIFSPILAQHPFFQRYAEIDTEAIRHVCLGAVRQISLSTEDFLFTEGRRCEQMFFVVAGTLAYKYCEPPSASTVAQASSSTGIWDQRLARTHTRVRRSEDLGMGEWCCEVSIWCPWVHTGSMTAQEMSEVLAVDVAAFARATSFFHLVNGFSARYAGLYAEKIQERLVEGAGVSDLSLFCPDELEEIVERAYLKRRPSEPAVKQPTGDWQLEKGRLPAEGEGDHSGTLTI